MTRRTAARMRPRVGPPALEGLEGRCLLAADFTITSSRQQTMDGFGTSLGGTTSASLVKTAAFQKAYYQDLGASVFRVALNPWLLRGPTKSGKTSMGSAVYMGPHIAENIRQFDFYNGNIQKYGLFARGAKKYGSDVKIIGSIWSPPYWMKGEEVSSASGRGTGVMPTFNDSTGNTSGGSLVASPANLTQFGRYVAAYVAGFEQAYGVHLDAISIQNELAFHESYSSAVYDPKLYVTAVKTVKHWFDAYGITTKLIGPEDVGVGSTSDTGILNRQMAYVKALRNDKDALAAVDAYAIHGYANDGVTTQRSPEMWARYWNGQKTGTGYSTYAGIKTDDKHSWMTEASGYGETWDATLRLASAVQDGVVQGNLSAYVYWGISNTTANGESLTKNTDYASGKYNAFKHFAKYVRPGSVRLETSDTDPSGVYASAFADDKAKTLTGVIVNNSDKDQLVTIRLDGPTLSRFSTVNATTEKHRWIDLDGLRVKNGRVTFTMAARSIYTLVGSTAGDGTGAADAGGSIRGVYFLDANRNGKQDKGEKGLAADKVYLDANANDVRDPGETTVVTAADGSFAFTGLAGGVYRVRRQLSDADWTITTPPLAIKLKKGAMAYTGLAIGAAEKSSGGGGDAKTASVAGHVFNDTDADGKQTGTEPDAVGKTVFLDANGNGALDAGETKTTTDANGDFKFTSLAAGTYRVRRVFPAGYTYSTTKVTLTLTQGEKKTGLLIGGKTV